MSIRWRCIQLTLVIILLLSVMTRHVVNGSNGTATNSSGSDSAGGTGDGATTGAPEGQASTLASALVTCSVGLLMACIL